MRRAGGFLARRETRRKCLILWIFGVWYPYFPRMECVWHPSRQCRASGAMARIVLRGVCRIETGAFKERTLRVNRFANPAISLIGKSQITAQHLCAVGCFNVKEPVQDCTIAEIDLGILFARQIKRFDIAPRER